jgi:hypothetical protein
VNCVLKNIQDPSLAVTLNRCSGFFVSVLISLTPEQLAAAEAEAQRRQQQNEARGLRGRNNAPSRGQTALEMHRLGCVGELAVAVFLGLEDSVFANETAVRGSTDLPGGIEVKTRSKSHYDLIVQKRENPSKKFVLVTFEDQKTLLHGWCYGHEAMDERYWADPAGGRPAYFVPQAALRPIETLL